ncbi:MAG: protein kinase [Myxococcales bacterium]|nr:protein kinase [Myxococcales bacterium]
MSSDKPIKSRPYGELAHDDDGLPSTRQAGQRDYLVGTVLDRKYRVLRKIGEGGMGSVYLADHEAIDRKVAVKVLLGKLAADSLAIRRFQQEAKAISKIQHPNTVTIYDYGKIVENDGEERLYIVMEFLRGSTLAQILRMEGPMEGLRASRVLRQVCASLADAHGIGIIHRDLKPDNIFLTEVGGNKDWVKVLDFGVAKLADGDSVGSLTQTGMIFGTPKYMSPEQAEGKKIDYRSDIYAIGVVLYELLTGQPPFISDTPVGLLLKHISEPPRPFQMVAGNRRIDPHLEGIVMRALEKNPDRRQQQVTEFATELEAYEQSRIGGHRGYARGGGVAVGPASFGVSPAEAHLSEVYDYDPLAAPITPLESGLWTSPERQPVTAALITYPEVPSHPETLGKGWTGAPPPHSSDRWWLVLAVIMMAGLVAFGVQHYRKPQLLTVSNGSVEGAPPQSEIEREGSMGAAVSTPPELTVPQTRQERRRRVVTSPAKIPQIVKEAPTITVHLVSIPAGARVRLDGRQVGVTPADIILPRGKGELVFTFRKKGYRSTRERVLSSRDQTVAARLRRRSSGAGTESPKRCAEGQPAPCLPKRDTGSVNFKVDDLK